MADYGAFPLWADQAGDLDTGELPLSASLVAELQEWAETHDRLLGPTFEWPSRQAKFDFVAEGRRLLDLLREELGPGYEVVYFDDIAGRVSRD